MTRSLRLYIAGAAARSIELTDTTTIGRDSDNDIVLDEATVSRYHVLLFVRAERVIIMDLESSNGTFVNGAQVLPDMLVRLADGDLIQIGRVRARYTETRFDQEASAGLLQQRAQRFEQLVWRHHFIQAAGDA
jgi:pSer/pThr/pTyr-binding forkhead associated (FHA) protein